MSEPFRIAIFASGGGSNFQAIVDAVKQGRLDVSIKLLVCDRPKAGVISRAEAAGIPSFIVRAKDYPSRVELDKDIVRQLDEAGPIDLIVLAGYMRLITDCLVQPYYGRMINVHPALLPAFPGLHAVEQALEYGVKAAGATVHFVDGGMDTGPIIAQKTVTVSNEDTIETLTTRIHAVEHELLPQVIQAIREGRVQIEGRRVHVFS
ncbi:MAG TPA: phosphoribosylglycinamide formyltransferase [Bacilli bacterium]